MWRTLASFTMILAGAGLAHAQSVFLGEAPLPKSCYRNDLTMALVGHITVQQEGKNLSLKQSAAAHHVFLERILEGTELGTKAARIYQAAGATIGVGADVSKRTLRPDRALMVAQRVRGQIVAYCPRGLLSDEEQELTDHFDTLAVPGILPAKQVAVGDTWTLGSQAVLALCDLDGLVGGTLTGKLVKVHGEVAEGTIDGIVKGIGMGAQVTLEIKARFAFDIKEKRIIAALWKQHDERLQGPISPALAADVTYQLKRTPILEPSELSEIALVRPLAAPVDKMTDIAYRDPQGRFECRFTRNWHLVGREEKHLVLRLLSERGDFIAQATLMPYRKSSGKTDVEDFARLMASTPGWEQEGDFLEKIASVNLASDSKIKVMRVGATGKLSGVPALQYFHLLTGPRGDQMIVTFTMDPKQAPNLQSQDLTLLRGITLPE